MTDLASPAPYRLNAVFAATVIATATLQLFVVPLALLPQAPWFAGLVIVLLALATPFCTAVLHEAIHGRLADRPTSNARMGRIIAICSGISFDVVRFGHLAHHRSNRHALDRPDVIEPGQSALSAGIKYYAHLFGGLYLTEVLATATMLLPRRVIVRLLKRAMAIDEPEITAIRIAAIRVLDRRIRRVRLDALCVILLYAAAFSLYGAWWMLLLVGILLRGFFVSLQDNAPHYGTLAVINAPAHNMRAPRWMATFMLNQNLHAVHHDQPDLHWTELPGAFGEARTRCSSHYITLLLRQFRGPRRPRASSAPEIGKGSRTVGVNTILLLLAMTVTLILPFERQAMAQQGNSALLAKFCDAKDIRGPECLKAKGYRDGETCNVKLTSKQYRGRFLSASAALVAVGYESDCEPHANNFGGSIVFEARGNDLVFRGYQPGVRLAACIVVAKDSQQDRLICLSGYMGQGHLFSSIVEIIFSRDSSNKLELKEDGLVSAEDNSGIHGVNTIDCKERMIRFDVSKPRPGPVPGTVLADVTYVDHFIIRRACRSTRRPKDVSTDVTLQKGEAFIDSREIRKGRLVIDLHTKEVFSEVGFNKRR